MNRPAFHLPGRRLLVLSTLVFVASGLTGCVSAKYKSVQKPLPPPALNLVTTTPVLEAYVRSVIVYHGPGSWKNEAYWDEYLVSFINRSDTTVVIDSVTLVDALDQEQFPGSDPWIVEDASRANLKKFEHHGKQILVGTGLGVAWGMAPAAAIGGALSGSSALALVGVTTFFVIPAAVVGHVIVSHHAKGSIVAEFNHRRLPLPIVLEPHLLGSGSLFFPVSPGPQRLHLRGHRGDKPLAVTVDLSSLAGLHFLKQPNPPAVASTSASP